jgi:hypothetical protein
MHQNHTVCERAARRTLRLRSLVCGAALLAAGWIIGSVASRPTAAQAQVINAAPDQHFLAGDQLSLPLLQEMCTTLHQMDARLGRLEVAADRIATERGMPAKRNALIAPEAQ